MSCMSGSPNLNSFRDRGQVAVQLVSCGVLLPGLVQDCTLDPFEFPYYFYCIRGELIYVLSIVVCIPSTFCPTLGHHQGRIYYKSDVAFVLAYYYCVKVGQKVLGINTTMDNT